MSKIFKNTAIKISTGPIPMERLDVDPKPSVQEAGGDLLALEREAYEKGFNAGEKAGFELGKQKAEVLFNGMGRLLEELTVFKERIFKPCEKEMVELCIAIAEKVIQREVEIKEDTILDCVRSALKFVIAGGEIVIKVNPKDIEMLNQYKSELMRYGDGVKGVAIDADDSISRGGCMIETNYGEIDATMGSLLEDVIERLRNAR